MKNFAKVLMLGTLVFMAGMVFGGAASATSIVPQLDIDFRLDPWNDANGGHRYTDDGVTAIALPGREMLLYQDGIDGLGVLNGSYEPDEIEEEERLAILFGGSGRELDGVLITDLFAPGDRLDGGNDTFGERGVVRLYDSNDNFYDRYIFKGEDSDQDNGEIYVSFDLPQGFAVSKAVFKTVGNYSNNDFSVAGFNETPEPATMFLLGSGLIGLVVARKRFAKKS